MREELGTLNYEDWGKGRSLYVFWYWEVCSMLIKITKRHFEPIDVHKGFMTIVNAYRTCRNIICASKYGIMDKKYTCFKKSGLVSLCISFIGLQKLMN